MFGIYVSLSSKITTVFWNCKQVLGHCYIYGYNVYSSQSQRWRKLIIFKDCYTYFLSLMSTNCYGGGKDGEKMSQKYCNHRKAAGAWIVLQVKNRQLLSVWNNMWKKCTVNRRDFWFHNIDLTQQQNLLLFLLSVKLNKKRQF